MALCRFAWDIYYYYNKGGKSVFRRAARIATQSARACAGASRAGIRVHPARLHFFIGHAAARGSRDAGTRRIRNLASTTTLLSRRYE